MGERAEEGRQDVVGVEASLASVESPGEPLYLNCAKHLRGIKNELFRL
jgi:hypothetical protein